MTASAHHGDSLPVPGSRRRVDGSCVWCTDSRDGPAAVTSGRQPHPAAGTQQDCPPVADDHFGATDIFGGSYADPSTP
jgi:hypothetical protein